MANVVWTDNDVFYRDSDVVWKNHLPAYVDIPQLVYKTSYKVIV